MKVTKGKYGLILVCIQSSRNNPHPIHNIDEETGEIGPAKQSRFKPKKSVQNKYGTSEWSS